MLPIQYIYIHTHTENGTNEKRQLPFVAANRNGKLPFVFCKRKNRKFVFLGRQTINGIRRLLLQQTCPSMVITDCKMLVNSTF